MSKLVKFKTIKKTIPRTQDVHKSLHLYEQVDRNTGAVGAPHGPVDFNSFHNLPELKNNPVILNKFKNLVKQLQLASKSHNKIKIDAIKKELNKLPWKHKNKFAEWDKYAVQDWQFFVDEQKHLMGKIIRGNAFGRILDVGSGSWNYFQPDFSELPFQRHITAIDGSKEALLRNQAHKKIQLDLNELNTGKKLPFKDEQFDTINLAFIMNYIKSPKVALVEFNRVIRKGGCFLILGSPYAGLAGEIKHNFDPERYKKILTSLGMNVKIHPIMYDREWVSTSTGKSTFERAELCKLIIAYKPK